MAKGSLNAATLVAFVAVGSLSDNALADDTKALWAFARANVDRFAPELKAAPGMVTVRFVAKDGPLALGQYDAEKGRLLSAFATLKQATVSEACAAAGEFEGRNSYGASAKVSRQRCNRLDIADTDEGMRLGDLDCTQSDKVNWNSEDAELPELCRKRNDRIVAIPMTPSQWRQAKAQGLMYQVEFMPGEGSKSELATVLHLRDPATVRRPTETELNLWEVRGRVKVVRVFSADGKTRFAEYKRD